MGEGIVEQLSVAIQQANEKMHQSGAEFPYVFAFIPWRHHVEIVTGCKTIDESLYYIRNTIQNGCSRQALHNCMHSDLYHVRGNAITTFKEQLTPVHAELVQEMIKENYNRSLTSMSMQSTDS